MSIDDIKSYIDNLSYELSLYNVVYRGIKESVIGSHLKEPYTDRILQGYTNYIYLLPSWKKFGYNRNKSIIASTSEEDASLYGTPYIIIPRINEVYVSPGYDFNKTESYPFLNNEYKKYIKSINNKLNTDSFNIIIGDIRHMITKFYEYIKGSEISYDWVGLNYVNVFKSIDDNIHTLMDANFKEMEVYYETYWDFFLDGFKKYKSSMKLMDYLFDPIKNGFKKMKYTYLIKELSKGNLTRNEVWFESECLLIDRDDYYELVKLYDI